MSLADFICKDCSRPITECACVHFPAKSERALSESTGPAKVVAAVPTGSRPCPFCGDVRRPEIEETKDREGSLFHAECQCCGAQGPLAITRGAALIQWDERHTPATQHEFVKLSDRLAGANAEMTHANTNKGQSHER